jgi:phage tail tape-measure protein
VCLQLIVCSVFDDVASAKAKGIAAGQKAAEQRASELGAHICGVVVAGMPYAIYVEAGHAIKKKDGTVVNVTGRDVLTGTYHQFPSMLEKRMQEVFKNDNTDWRIT